MTRRIAHAVLSGLMARGPARGTWAHQMTGLVTAVILGLVVYWVRTHR